MIKNHIANSQLFSRSVVKKIKTYERRGHYNHHNVAHASPDASSQHVGDMGNIEANQYGKVNLKRKLSFLSMAGADSIIGRAVVMHAGPDDFMSQPSGAAGPRVACGVIGIAK